MNTVTTADDFAATARWDEFAERHSIFHDVRLVSSRTERPRQLGRRLRGECTVVTRWRVEVFGRTTLRTDIETDGWQPHPLQVLTEDPPDHGPEGMARILACLGPCAFAELASAGADF